MSEGQKNRSVRITIDEAKKLYDEEEVTVLDVVDSVTFDKLDYKIKGAERINPKDVAEEYQQLPKDQTVLAY
jgi:rhodanese-related sulfurtransferase